MDVDVLERHLVHEVEAHHHHPGDPEEDDVEGGDQRRRRVIMLQLGRLFGPAQGRERPERRGEPGVEHVLVARQRDGVAVMRHRQRLRLGFRLGDEDLAIRPVPGRDLVAPPELARDAPGLDVLEPVIIGLGPALRRDLGATVLDRLERAIGQRLDVDIPLVGQPGLDHDIRAVAMGHGMGVRLDLHQQATRSHHLDDAAARDEAVGAVERERLGLRLGTGQEILVAGEQDARLAVEDIDDVELVALADLEIVEVMGRRDLDCARALLGIGIVVAEDRDDAADQRQHRLAADQMADRLVVGVNRDAGIAQHRLGPSGRDGDEGRGVVGVIGRAFERIVEIVEMAIRIAAQGLVELGRVEFVLAAALPFERAGLLDLQNLEIRDRGLEFRVPIHQPLGAVDQALLVQPDEDLEDGGRQPLIHGEALARPVAGGAEPAELVDDRAAGLLLPLPDLGEEGLAAHAAAVSTVLGGKLALDDHLRRDAGMVGAGLPEHVLAAQALEAAEHVLERVVERVAHMQRAGDVRRRNHDAIGLGAGGRTPARLEGLRLVPGLADPGLDGGRFESLVHHRIARTQKGRGTCPGRKKHGPKRSRPLRAHAQAARQRFR